MPAEPRKKFLTGYLIPHQAKVDTFERAVQALTNFTPRQNRQYEIYVFRQAKQESNESISAFHTRLT